jgi:peptidyl-tRNA hydrolase, PTH1 family
MPPPIHLIVGLGNPGAEYAETRHNAGFWFVDNLARRYQASFKSESKFHGQICRIRADGVECWLVKPATFMNKSGRSVASLANYYRIPMEEMLVVHDELDLAAGTVRLKQGGGHAGHNGLRDIISAIGGRDFWRLRVGISRPGGAGGGQVVNYVLGRPARDEAAAIEDAISEAERILGDLLSGDFQKAMHRLHSSG